MEDYRKVYEWVQDGGDWINTAWQDIAKQLCLYRGNIYHVLGYVSVAAYALGYTRTMLEGSDIMRLDISRGRPKRKWAAIERAGKQRERGVSTQDIAKAEGVSKRTIERRIKEYNEKKSKRIKRKKTKTYKQALKELNCIKRQSRQNKLQNECNGAEGVDTPSFGRRSAPRLSFEHKKYIVRYVASGVPYAEIATGLRETYPYLKPYGMGVSEYTRKMVSRIGSMKHRDDNDGWGFVMRFTHEMVEKRAKGIFPDDEAAPMWALSPLRNELDTGQKRGHEISIVITIIIALDRIERENPKSNTASIPDGEDEAVLVEDKTGAYHYTNRDQQKTAAASSTPAPNTPAPKSKLIRIHRLTPAHLLGRARFRKPDT